ncbi:MAG TPA: alanine racemase [Solirubrobacteraceae bacterium]|jgi:alanine racemase|nr:alanine racemase [Solirubrobacteraceae bacterium]
MSVARARASVDRGAIAHNCARLLGVLDGSELCAVVKADGYGHGAVECAAAALHAGATWLAVATVEEASELRDAGIEAPMLIMGALADREEIERAVELRADIVVWRERSVALASEAAALVSGVARVHVKLDTGMGRLGTRDVAEASRVVAAAAIAPGVQLAGVMTHFATADVADDDGFFERQLAAFTQWSGAVRAEHPEVLVHAANSAALLREPRGARFDMARCGIAVYGLDPFNEDPFARDLTPALTLSSYVAEVKPCRVGESTGYGRRYVADRDTHLGVLPIGYGDGFRRALSGAADVLIAGSRLPLVGTVSMDNVAVDLGPEPAAFELCGAEAILIGSSGPERITAEELAGRMDTINYEITCGLSARVRRTYLSSSAPAP